MNEMNVDNNNHLVKLKYFSHKRMACVEFYPRNSHVSAFVNTEQPRAHGIFMRTRLTAKSIFHFLVFKDRIRLVMKGFGYAVSLRTMTDARDILECNDELSLRQEHGEPCIQLTGRPPLCDLKKNTIRVLTSKLEIL